jgi:predicted enzyme related to lactoylglutathione lyase
MINKMGNITILVEDYDTAIEFYTEKMGFKVTADNVFGSFRWVTVALPNQQNIGIVFVKADTETKQDRVGSQVANHVFITLETDDVDRDYKTMKEKGVVFYGEPKDMPYGREVVFEDLYGNRFDLITVRQ